MQIIRIAGKPALMLLAVLLIPGPAKTPAQVVISQIYGGGGNTGSPLSHDFIELFNQGQDPVQIAGWSVQYSSATGSSWQVTALSGEILPHQWFLVGEAGGTSGAGLPLPTPDVVGVFGMSATGGKVALVDTVGALSGVCPSSSRVVDFVGWGSASCFQGSGAAPATSNTTALMRRDSGMAASGDNALDFTATSPNPRNSQTTPLPVKVIMFHAILVAQSTAELTWKTLSEVNNFGFHVERRLPPDSGFAAIPGSFQSGFGTTLVEHSYRFVDSLARGVDFYRLRQVDLDGTIHYSEAIQATPLMAVSRRDANSGISLDIFPNPFNPTTVIRGQWPAAGEVRLAVYDLLGREVALLVNEKHAPGRYEVRFDGSRLAGGTYFCRLTAGPSIMVRTMTLVK